MQCQARADGCDSLTAPIVRILFAGSVGYFGTLFSGGDVSDSDSGARFSFDLGIQLNIPRAPDTRVFVTPVLYLSNSISYSPGNDSVFDLNRTWSQQTSAILAAAISF